MKYNTYIFDLDGTLLSTLGDLAASCNYALRSCGMPERSLDEVRQFVGNGVKMLMIRAVPGEVRRMLTLKRRMPHSVNTICTTILIPQPLILVSLIC